jgi:hypothetical protein
MPFLHQKHTIPALFDSLKSDYTKAEKDGD